jgi:hypothetical protein
VRWRWAKLFLVYFASGVAQIVVPIALLGLVMLAIRGKTSLVGLILGITIGFATSVLGALVGATSTSVSLRGSSRRPK